MQQSRAGAQDGSVSKHERLPAKLSRDLDAFSARICRGRGNDEGSSFSDWEDASSNTGHPV